MNITIPDELVDAIADRVAELLDGKLGENGSSPWLDIAGAASYLPTTPDAVRAMVKRNRIPYHKPAGRLLFDKDELAAWIRKDAA